MAAKNFDAVMDIVLAEEGGYVDHAADPGGATKYGITIKTLTAHRAPHPVTKVDVNALTVAEAKAIYRKSYWNAIRGDDLPSGVDLAVMDYAVNSGPARAAKELQGLVGVAQDGVIGDQTIAACRTLSAKALVWKLCDARLGFLRRLKTWGTFGKGWSRRVQRVRDKASIMAAGGVAIPATDAETLPKARPSDRTVMSTKEGKAGAAAAIGTVATEAARQIEPYSEAFATLKWVFIALTLISVVVGAYVAYQRIRRG